MHTTSCVPRQKPSLQSPIIDNAKSNPKLASWFFASFLVLAISGQSALAEVLFEGYSKIISNGMHIGYTLSRYEIDPKQNKFIGTHYVQINTGQDATTESYTTISNTDLVPQQLIYNLVSVQELKKIEGKKVKDQWVITTSTVDPAVIAKNPKKKVKENTKTKKIALEKETIFSSNLVYFLMNPKINGLREKMARNYSGIAEEDGMIYEGKFSVENLDKTAPIPYFFIANDFKNVKFSAQVAQNGHVIATRSPGLGLETLLMAVPTEATKGIASSSESLKALFGEVPLGTKNVVSEEYKNSPAPKLNEDVQSPAGKDPLPAGRGLHQKGG